MRNSPLEIYSFLRKRPIARGKGTPKNSIKVAALQTYVETRPFIITYSELALKISRTRLKIVLEEKACSRH
jgi:hypothetical protein